MLEINVTELSCDELSDYSTSVFESGPNAARISWNKSLSCPYAIVNDSNRSEVINHFLGYGAWEKEELDNSSLQELNAMLIQDASSALREYYEAKEEYCYSREMWQNWQDNHGGRVFENEEEGFVYYTIGE